MQNHLAAVVLAAGAFVPTTGFARDVQLTGTVRDFNDTHADFESALGTDRNIVERHLGLDGKPVYAGGTGTRAFHEDRECRSNHDVCYADCCPPDVNAGRHRGRPQLRFIKS